jgi:O-antigen ligase
LIWPVLALALALVWIGRAERPLFPNFQKNAALFFLAVIALGAMSLFWSVAPERSLGKAGGLILVCSGVLILFSANRQLTREGLKAVGTALAFGLGISCLILVGELLSDGFLLRQFKNMDGKGIEETFSHFNRGLAVIGIMLWPVLAILERQGRRLGAFGLCAVVLAVFWALYGTSFALALTLGVLGCAFSILTPKRATYLLGCLAGLWIMVAPLAMERALVGIDPGAMISKSSNSSVIHRLYIWKFVTKKIQEKPLLGYGLGASRAVPGGQRTVAVSLPLHLVGFPLMGSLISLHTHNGPLQLWLELGVMGATLGTLGIFLLFAMAAKADSRIMRGLMVGQITTAFVIYNLSFGIWQAWWLVTLALGAFYMALLKGPVLRS